MAADFMFAKILCQALFAWVDGADVWSSRVAEKGRRVGRAKARGRLAPHGELKNDGHSGRTVAVRFTAYADRFSSQRLETGFG